MNFENYHTLTINGQTLKGLEITEYCKRSEQPNIRLIGSFMSEWLSDKPFLEVRTSGSTGTPKIISVEKNQMLHSASMTAGYFDFQPGQTALLCLPMNYIAGKMMVVRALFSQLNLFCIEPDNQPLQKIPANVKIDFAPLVPMQLRDATGINQVEKILLGGSMVAPRLEERLQKPDTEIYHGYGMTETLSHVAIRKVNGPDRSEIFRSLNGIYFDKDERDCLVIDIPFFKNLVYTNDVVELLDEQQFIWKGRIDNVINSGGVKLFPEEIERKLSFVIRDHFFVAGVADERFGEKLCLFVEGETPDEDTMQQFRNRIEQYVDKYEKPRDICFVGKFIYTESGKVKRNETIRMVNGY